MTDLERLELVLRRVHDRLRSRQHASQHQMTLYVLKRIIEELHEGEQQMIIKPTTD